MEQTTVKWQEWYEAVPTGPWIKKLFPAADVYLNSTFTLIKKSVGMGVLKVSIQNEKVFYYKQMQL